VEWTDVALQARRCLPAIETFEEEDQEGIDDTDEGDEEARILSKKLKMKEGKNLPAI